MKIMAVCGSGLGSSFMVEMNIQQVLNDLGVTSVEVSHNDLASTTSDMADVFVTGIDLEEAAAHLKNLIVLSNILDMDELQEKIEQVLQVQGVL